MAKSKQRMEARIIKEHKQQAPVTKADVSVQVTPEDAFNAGDWIMPMNDRIGLRTLVKHSTILPQCIRAYKNNIAGFGIGVRYVDDVEETPEMAAEYSRAEEIIELLNIEQDTKEVFEDIIEARETYGAAYIEVIRDVAGDVVQIEFIKDTPSVYKTKPLEPYIGSKYNLLTLPTIPTTTSTPAKHAAGGRVGGGPQLSWLAEEGWDEFVIPTNPSRRTRALELYEQAGEALGVSKHAEGGRIEGSNLSDMVSDHNLFTEATRNASYGYNETTEGNYEDNSAETFAPVSSEVPTSTPQTGPISVNVAVSPNFQIEAKEGQSEEDIVAVIRRHLGEIADELGGNIADKLSEVFANMPVTSTKGA